MKSISGKKLASILQKKGWILIRTRGSHHTFENTSLARKVVVPLHGNKDLPIGTLAGILKDAGLTFNDLS